MSRTARYWSKRGDQLTISAMLNWTATTALAFFLAANLFGQTPAPSATPSTEQIINSLGENDLQSAIALLKSNFTNPEAITDTELNRATLAGMLVPMPGGLVVLPSHENAPVEPVAPVYSEGV